MMLGVALLAACTQVCLFILWARDPQGWLTVYAPGYSDAKFDALTPGMTPVQVEAVMGKPLGRVPWSRHIPGSDQEMWYYSDNQVNTANFWRRWVVFEGGKSTAIIKDFWVD